MQTSSKEMSNSNNGEVNGGDSSGVDRDVWSGGVSCDNVGLGHPHVPALQVGGVQVLQQQAGTAHSAHDGAISAKPTSPHLGLGGSAGEEPDTANATVGNPAGSIREM